MGSKGRLQQVVTETEQLVSMIGQMGAALAPGRRTDLLTDFDQMEVGVWEHTVGSSTDVEGDEVAVVFAGRGTLTLSDGSSIDLYPGVLFTLREGEHTTWDITEPLRKAYLARRLPGTHEALEDQQ